MRERGKNGVLPKVALVGHPNVGKTTLFNRLTGERRKVGNYPGVTVEKVSATVFTPHGKKIELVDLPGCYSLSPNSPDEAVTRDVLLGDHEGESRPELVICVVDAASLERHLYLVMQVVDAGLPVVVALNQADRAEAEGLRINREVLRDLLDVAVIPCQATNGQGLVDLKQTLRFPLPAPVSRQWKGPAAVESAIQKLTRTLAESGVSRPEAHAIHLLADPDYRLNGQARVLRAAQIEARQTAAGLIERDLKPEEVISEARRAAIRGVVRAAVVRRGDEEESRSDRIDRWVLHPLWGWVIFAAAMFGVFWTIFSFASIPMDLIERVVGAAGGAVGSLLPEGDFKDLLVNGVIGGVGCPAVFVHRIA